MAGASIGIGYGKSVDKIAQSASTNAASTLSAGRDVTISAGRDANLQATRVEAGGDATILADRNVNLLSAQDVSNYTAMHEELFAGVSLSVSSGLVSAAEGVQSAAASLGNGGGLYAAAPTALAAINAYETFDDVIKHRDESGIRIADGRLLHIRSKRMRQLRQRPSSRRYEPAMRSP